MIDRIIRFALLHSGPVLAGALVVLVYGAWLAAAFPIDVFPDLDRPRVVLMTEAPGLSPEEVEAMVSQPIETVMLGAPGVEAVRGQAANGLAVTYVEFGWKTDVRSARQTVQERLLTVASTLPPGVRPLMTAPSSILGQVMHVGLYRTGKAPQPDFAPRTVADWVVRPRLLREPGVAEVIVLGGDRKQFQVLVDPAKLIEYGVSLKDVEQAVRDNNLNASGGFTEEGQVERPIRVIARLGPEPGRTLDELRKIPVKASIRPVLLGQVAEVKEAAPPKRGDAGIDGSPGVVITVVKQPHADTNDLTRRVQAALKEMEPGLPPGVRFETDLFQLKAFIDRGIHYVVEALVVGALLVIAVLFLFLLSVRTTLITLTAIPLSLAVTAVVFKMIGVLSGTELSINVMTLGGLAVAMGELVDDAIVDVENIHRRLCENTALPDPKPTLRVVYEASREIRSAIVFGTAVVILAFLPLFALSGVEGRLFAPLGVAYIVSILASLAVSVTVTPVLSYLLLGSEGKGHPEAKRDSFIVRILKALATPLIRFSMGAPGLLLLFTWLAVGYAGWRLSGIGADFLPKFDEGSVQINVSLPPGSSLAATNSTAVLVDDTLRGWLKTDANPNGPVRHFIRRSGRAELDEHVEPVGRSEYILTMNPDNKADRDATLKKLLDELKENVPGVEFEAEQPLAHLISHMLSGVTAQIAVKIHGDDLDVLQKLANRVKTAIADVPGLTAPVIEPQETVDELHIVPRPDDLALYGLSRAAVAEFVQSALKGDVVSQVLDGQRRFDLVVKLKEPERLDYGKLRDLRLDLPNGRGQVRLGDIADFPEAAGGPNQVNRENNRRRAVIRCNVSGSDLGSAVAEIERRVAAGVPMPEGYFVEYGGQFQAQRSATMLIGVLAGLSALGILVVLYTLYPSLRIALQILNAIPTAFIGGVIALLITKQTLTVAALVGFVSLGGIAVRNGILLVTHYFHLMKEEGQPFGKAMILRGSLERLPPVLMTALTAGIALVPIVLGGHKPGLEILYPVATVILGGLVTSTFCEFLVHPGLFHRFSGKDAERLAKEDEKTNPLKEALR